MAGPGRSCWCSITCFHHEIELNHLKTTRLVMAYFSGMSLTRALSTEHEAAAPTLATHSLNGLSNPIYPWSSLNEKASCDPGSICGNCPQASPEAICTTMGTHPIAPIYLPPSWHWPRAHTGHVCWLKAGWGLQKHWILSLLMGGQRKPCPASA